MHNGPVRMPGKVAGWGKPSRSAVPRPPTSIETSQASLKPAATSENQMILFIQPIRQAQPASFSASERAEYHSRISKTIKCCVYES